jgi:hypothetical protein
MVFMMRLLLLFGTIAAGFGMYGPPGDRVDGI